jgi:hypothetical protein
MATTTTNFGWDIPQSTDLVKDGATAIAALGQDIDTALIDLKGGTTGQVLAKATNTDLDFSWVAQDDSNAIQNAIVDAKGDLIVATAADTPARLAVGANGYFLQADSTAATGLAWATASAGNFIKIAANTFSNQASVAIDSVFSATYRNYVVILNAFAVTDTDDFQLQFRYAGSTQTSTYYGAYTQIDRANATTNSGYTNASQATLALSMETTANGASGACLNFTNVGIAGKPKFYGTGILLNGPATISLAAFQDTSRTYDGILIKSSSSNITGNYAVYGVSN